MVPLLTDIRCAEGVNWIDSYPVGVGEAWVPRYGVEGKNVFAVRVIGDSMVPDLYPGDILIINPDVPFTNFKGGIGVIQHGETYLIRKIYKVGDMYNLVPSNELYEPDTAPVKDTRIFKVAQWIPKAKGKF